NKAMESKLYPEAIELYTVAIALCGDNAIYYCNRAAAYTYTGQDAEQSLTARKQLQSTQSTSRPTVV
ncbi:small glutamine-rich tetratricopeptide repeat-containing protein, partial [Tanacetum coccineum]